MLKSLYWSDVLLSTKAAYHYVRFAYFPFAIE